ncbi:uncharacterized protein LOC111624042 isoform X2 [Centruroides sculpturatus]|uniref:uncharacterized protein LOC111623547 isoform X2 n=1 Tax=Centruroides sculpturatus TaxID=218467 RepID=UPI000C6CA04F|nr:uncharacterized protein LOC111623547 isoform X2 [Centruroides sculpturatus]XP_023222591.1 uncharacterized protein LOC111624042 isoform X2 [Centruroides sculpturatus]
MISAMPAVAVRRERKKSKSQRAGTKGGRQGSLSTISSTGAQASYGSRTRTNASAFQSVGLLFIGLGSLLCLIKIFCGNSPREGRDDRKRQQEGSSTVSPSYLSPVLIENTDPPVVMVQTLPLSDVEEGDRESIVANNSPTVKNTVPEMQVLITDNLKERY